MDSLNALAIRSNDEPPTTGRADWMIVSKDVARLGIEKVFTFWGLMPLVFAPSPHDDIVFYQSVSSASEPSPKVQVWIQRAGARLRFQSQVPAVGCGIRFSAGAIELLDRSSGSDSGRMHHQLITEMLRVSPFAPLPTINLAAFQEIAMRRFGNPLADSSRQLATIKSAESMATEGFGGEKICSMLGISRAYLYRALSLTGLPPKAFGRLCRVRHGVDLICQGQARKSVSTSLGYKSDTHFSADCMLALGVPPIRAAKMVARQAMHLRMPAPPNFYGESIQGY